MPDPLRGPVPDITHYACYRTFIRDWLAMRPSRTVRGMARGQPFSHQMVCAVIHRDPARRRNPSRRMQLALARAMRLDPEETERFLALCALDHARTAAERRRARARLRRMVAASAA